MQAGGGMQGGMGQPSQPFGMGGGGDAGAMGGGGGQADYGFQPFDSSFGSDAGGQDMYGGEMQSMPLGDDDDGDDLPLLEGMGACLCVCVVCAVVSRHHCWLVCLGVACSA